MTLLDGKQIANEIKTEIATEVKSLVDNGQEVPHLAAVIVGEESAAKTYINSIERTCKEVGFISSIYQCPEKVTKEELLGIIDFLNQDSEVDGYIIQMPLPKHLSSKRIIERINPDKDVDCMHPSNIGKLVTGDALFIPATPLGTIELIKRSHIETEGKHCVVLGRSAIVGKPLALLLAEKSATGNATVTICHSKTKNLKEVCAQADILLVAIGQAEMIDADYIKEGATVIDIGIHRVEDSTREKGYRVCGDVQFDEVSRKAAYITPVPGGVGQMTMASLLLNTFKAYKHKRTQTT